MFNDIGPEGGELIAKALHVSIHIPQTNNLGISISLILAWNQQKQMLMSTYFNIVQMYIFCCTSFRHHMSTFELTFNTVLWINHNGKY